ncbi:MAG: nodulation protein NfeD, partial [Halomonadaceae bacterium]
MHHTIKKPDWVRRVSAICLLALGCFSLLLTAGAQDNDTNNTRQEVWVMNLTGAIGPAVADWFIRTLEDAEEAEAEMLVLELDTPGGLDNAMRDMIQKILDSSVPVATYVTPRGARAASAGTYLLYASHVAAMAPATNLGSATPVQMGGGGGDDDGGMPMSLGTVLPALASTEGNGDNDRDPEAEAEREALEEEMEDQVPGNTEGMSAMEKKVINDAVAYIRGLAELRGRNADWAEEAVR